MSRTRPRIAALALPPIVGGEQLLLPAGRFEAPRGAMLGEGPWTLSEADGAALAAALSARVRDLPVDYEHQILRAVDNGQPAPASGWIRPADIAWRPGVGLVAASVAWTERAAAHIGAGEYRYLSPVFAYDRGGVPRDLLHVALTNTPALDTLPEVALAAASLYSCPEAPMDDLRERVLPLLNLPADSTDEQLAGALDRITALMGAARMPDGTAAASLPDYLEATGRQVEALRTAAASAVPGDVAAGLQREIAELRTAAATRERSELIAACVADGRLVTGTPLHAHAEGLSIEALRPLVASLTPIAALSATQSGGRAPAAGTAADPDAERVRKQLGLSPEQWKQASEETA